MKKKSADSKKKSNQTKKSPGKLKKVTKKDLLKIKGGVKQSVCRMILPNL